MWTTKCWMSDYQNVEQYTHPPRPLHVGGPDTHLIKLHLYCVYSWLMKDQEVSGVKVIQLKITYSEPLCPGRTDGAAICIAKRYLPLINQRKEGFYGCAGESVAGSSSAVLLRGPGPQQLEGSKIWIWGVCWRRWNNRRARLLIMSSYKEFLWLN